MRHAHTPSPLDQPALERLALRYVERFATTEGKLTDYLRRKLRERGWAGEAAADPATVAARMVALGYVDDRSFAEAKAAGMARRGLGARRVADALRAARVGEVDRAAAMPGGEDEALAAALAFARRRRIGPFGSGDPIDADTQRKQLAAFARAGHAFALSRRIVFASRDDMIDVGSVDSTHCDAEHSC